MAFDFEALEGVEHRLLATVDGEIAARVRQAVAEAAPEAPKGVRRASSPWLPFGAFAPASRVRLFCFFGAGKQARDFKAWHQLGLDIAEAICVCPVELPGHALHRGATVDDAHVIAERFIEEVMDRVQDDGQEFALCGFSIGARIAYEVARRRRPLRLYVAGRAAPHVRARRTPEEPTEYSFLRGDSATAMRYACKHWGTEKEMLAMERLISMAEEDGDWDMLNTYAKSTLDDLDIGATLPRACDLSGQPLDRAVRCRVLVYEGGLDTSWPPSQILNTWDDYQACGLTSKTTYEELTHDALCAPSGRPLLAEVLADLSALLLLAELP